jgi:hypothetical protein
MKTASYEEQLRQDALKRILTFAGLGIGLGGLGRLWLGRNRVFGLPALPGVKPRSEVVPVYTHREEEEPEPPAQVKRADGWLDRASSLFPGGNPARLRDLPGFLPGVTLASIGGVAGGYSLMDWLLDRKRKSDLEGELSEAQDRYRRSLMLQAAPVAQAKTAAAALDDLARQYAAAPEPVKQAFSLGEAKGLYATMALLSALAGGSMAYQFTKQRSPQRLLEEAVKQRARDRWARRPPDIVAEPTPLSISSRGKVRGNPEDAALPAV